MEIELKFTITDLDKIEQILLSLGAELKKEKHQVDIYFDHPDRNLVNTNEYLRVRTTDDKSEFDYHIARSQTQGFNEEFELEINDSNKLIDIIKRLGFKQLGTIDKFRRQYLIEGSKICLDRVVGVGNFVEVEVQGDDETIGKNKCWQVAKQIGLTKKDQTSLLLCDIAVGKTPVKVS